MKGTASGTAQHNIITEYILNILGLTYAADTQVPPSSFSPARSTEGHQVNCLVGCQIPCLCLISRKYKQQILHYI